MMKKQHTTTSVQRSKSAKGGWIGYVYYYDDNGKRHKKSAGRCRLKGEAQQAANDLATELLKANPSLTDISFTEYYQHWFDTYILPSDKTKGTKYKYRLVGKKIETFFHDQKLKDITKTKYQEFLNWYGANHSQESARKVHSRCENCVSYAIDDDIISKDFTHHSQLIYNPKNTRHPEYLNGEETSLFKKQVIAGLDCHYTSRYMILTALYTGCRIGEVQGLTWDNINFNEHTISINKQWFEKEKHFGKTKTPSSKRTIKVNQILLDYLLQLKNNGSTMVFMNCFGTVPTSTAANNKIKEILADCKIKKRDFTFHSLRHVHVAYLINKGIEIYAISKRLGHSNINVTLSRYAYLIDEYKTKNDDEIVTALEAI